MKYSNNKMNDINIAYIGGGSRGWAWTLMTDLALEEQLSGTVRLFDIDKKAAEQNEIIGNRLKMHKDVKSKWNYQTAEKLNDALTDADFVIISILPGTFDEMESDVHMPERLGIYQPVGDTAGPGGIVRALRTIPMFVEIAEAIKKHAPHAWVINYTNPMSICVKTLYRAFPEIKAFGCCHEVFGTQQMLAGILKETQNISNINRTEIITNVMGINHFTWFDTASYKGIDLFPVFSEYIEKHFEKGFIDPDNKHAGTVFDCAHRVKFDLFRKYGLIASAGDRHLAEFMPGEMYLNNPETVEKWKFKLTPVSWRKEDLKNRLARSGRLVSGEEQLDLNASGEEGVQLIKALCGLSRIISNVNLPNSGSQISNLLCTSIVETNAVFEKDAVRPVIAGSIPDQILPLIMPHVNNHEIILKAALECDFDLVLQAFHNDPLLKGRASDDDIHALARDMISGTMKYLPEGWRKSKK